METIKISELPTGIPSTDDIMVFVDRADGVTKRADQDEFPAAAGDVTGPASSTDNAIARFDSTTGKILQNSTVSLSDDGDLSGIRTETFGSSNDRSQMIFANPDGSGSSIFSYSGLGGYNSIEMVRNAKYDPTSADWIRFDVSKPVGELLVDQSGNFEYWTAPAGANPIANWEQQFGMSSTGSATFNVGSNDADFTIKKNTSGNAYVYDAGADTHSFSGSVAIDGARTKTTSPLVVSAASYTTNTGTSLNMDNLDMFVITAQAGALLFNAPGGTLVQGRQLIIRIKDNGTARALTWNAVFRAMGTALPSTTVLSKTLYLGFMYNSTDTKWDLIASAQEA